MTTRSARLRSDDGSMMLTMLAAIIIGGLVVALFSTSITGQQRVRDDRDYQHVINGANAGLQQAVAVISELEEDDLDTVILTSDDMDDTSLDGIDFTWEATRESPISWNLAGVGELNGVERHVEARAVRDAMFFVAAFADLGFVMRGDNEVRSYTDLAYDTGFGAVGSNGEIEIRGNSSWVDLIMLMGGDADCTSGHRCDDRPITGLPDKLDLDAVLEDIQAGMDAACAPSDFRSYDAEADGPLQAGETYCLTELVVGQHEDLVVEDASQDDPAIVYINNGVLETGNHSTTNCDGTTWNACTTAERPESQSLQIYSTGTQVRLGNQSAIAAAVSAPRANCSGSPSNAQADIFGAMVCNDLTNQGGWDFNFDERLLNLGSGQFELKDWREEPGGTTSASTD